jgi:TrmH family RNA methyltransferase
MELEITSVKNPRIKEAMRLRDRRGRDRQGRILVDGLRECLRAIDAGLNGGELFVCAEHLDERQRVAIDENLRDSPVQMTRVTDEVFRKIAYGNRAEGVVLVTPRPDTALQNLQLGHNPLVAVLEHVEKPGNLGAVIRTADAAGVSAVIVVDGGTDLYNPNAIRASLGAIFKMPIAAGTADETIEWLRSRDVTMFATRVDGAVNYTNADFRKPAAIVLGSESLGLSDRWRDEDMPAIMVPMLGVVDSLNVSATAAVLFYEAVRQRCQT